MSLQEEGCVVDVKLFSSSILLCQLLHPAQGHQVVLWPFANAVLRNPLVFVNHSIVMFF